MLPTALDAEDEDEDELAGVVELLIAVTETLLAVDAVVALAIVVVIAVCESPSG